MNSTSALLGSEPIGKLLLRYSIPAIISMIATSLYNVIDTFFIGHLHGSVAVASLTVSFPLMNLIAAFAALVSVGGGVLMSTFLGAKDLDRAHRVLGNLVILSIAMGVLITIITLIFLNPILYFFGATEATLPDARKYMIIILSGSIIIQLYFCINSLLRACGHPNFALIATLVTLILNVGLNALFMFIFKWGIIGSAIATLLSQLIALVWMLWRFRDENEEVHFHKGIFKIDWKIVKDCFSVGMSPFALNAAACFVVIIINISLRKLDDQDAIAAYGIVNRFLYIFLMIVLGVSKGLIPIVSYNHGAGNYDRIKKTLTLASIWGIAIMILCLLCSELFPNLLSNMFSKNKALDTIAKEAFRVIPICYPLVGFQIIAIAFLQATKRRIPALILALSRQVLFLIPFLLLFSHWFGIKGVWISMPLSDLLSSALALFFVLYTLKHACRAEQLKNNSNNHINKQP